MKVLQINTVCGLGSTGRIATDLHAILVTQGYQSRVAFGRNEASACGDTFRIGTSIDIYAHAARTRIFDSHGFGSVRATVEFIAKIRAWDPDVIHLHNLHGYYLHIGRLFEYLKEAGKPVVWTLHDCWAFAGHCTYFDYCCCERWKSECHDCPQKSQYPRSWLLDRSRRNFREKKAIFTEVPDLTLVSPSLWLAGLVGESFLKNYPVMVIPNGIDLGAFTPTSGDFRKRHGLEGRFVMLGVASVWDERKGYQTFVELAKRLRADEAIVMVGLSDAQIRNLPPGIIGIAKTTCLAALAEIYSAVDVFVNPTLEDNFPTTNLESLGCGTPVVTYDSGGSPECIDEQTGIVVKRGDLSSLLSAIATVKACGKAAYTAACRQRAEDHFDRNARFAEYLALYGRK